MTTRYTPGDWHAVVTPAGVALLPPDVEPDVIERVWDRLSSGKGLGGVLESLTGAFGTSLSAIPPFAVVVIGAIPVRLAVRGEIDVRVTTTTGETTVISGLGVTTWSERLFDDAAAVEIVRHGVPASPRTFVLGDGIALASQVRLVLSDVEPTTAIVADAPIPITPSPSQAVADGPQVERAPDDGDRDEADDTWMPQADTFSEDDPAAEAADTGAPDTEAADTEHADTEHADTEHADTEHADTEHADTEQADADADDAGDAADADTRDADAEVDGAQPDHRGAPPVFIPSPPPNPAAENPAGDPFDALWDETVAKPVEDAAVRPDVEPESDSTIGPPAPPVSAAQPGDHDGETVSWEQVQRMRAAAQAAPVGSPPSAPPVVGRIELSNGTRVPLDRPVVIGRRPRAPHVTSGPLPHLVAVDSPEQDISRSHVEIRREGDATLVVDLDTTNGTMLLRVGSAPKRLHPGEATIVIEGDVIDLGDGVTATFRDIG